MRPKVQSIYICVAEGAILSSLNFRFRDYGLGFRIHRADKAGSDGEAGLLEASPVHVEERWLVYSKRLSVYPRRLHYRRKYILKREFSDHETGYQSSQSASRIRNTR